VLSPPVSTVWKRGTLMELLEMKKICKSFSGIQVLFDVDFVLKAGEIHCLAGENGAGKSTIVKILTGVYDDYSGEIFVEGNPVRINTPLQSRACGIYAVQQHRDLVPTLSGAENIFIGNYILKSNNRAIDYKAMYSKAYDYLKKFQVDIDLSVPVRELKVGEQGIIAICKAISSEGKILIMDEASAPLDNFERQVLFQLLRTLRDEGKGIIYITHHIEEMFEIGDSVDILRNGVNVCSISTSEINKEELINTMTGNKELYKRKMEKHSIVKERDETPIFEYQNVSNNMLTDVSFSIYKGEIIGFAGVEGSGKEIIADMAFGMAKPISGEIKFKNQTYDVNTPTDAIKKGIGLVPTDRNVQGLVRCRPLAENLIIIHINKSKKNFVNRRWMLSKAEESIKLLGIVASSPVQLVEYLSGGNQQKTLIGKWIHAESEVLFLIEPTEGIDVGARADIYKLLKKLSDSGKTLIIFSSDLDELMALCNRVFTMADGKIISEYDANNADKRDILSDILMRQESEV
jgi:ribose transport system ATP-binding protein